MFLIAYTLLVLYSLPLLVLLITFLVSSGFTESSSLIEFSIALSGIYLTPTRDTLGTFVVPFVTAYATTTIQKGVGVERATLVFFFVLVAIFLLSILVYCAVNMRVDLLLTQLSETNQSVLSGSKEKLLAVAASYVKETLAYISLLLGISQAPKVGTK
jgi:hypothetical protein